MGTREKVIRKGKVETKKPIVEPEVAAPSRNPIPLLNLEPGGC